MSGYRVPDDARATLAACVRDSAGVEFCVRLMELIHVWDDLTDGDPAENDDVHRAFTDALTGFDANPFFLAFQSSLRPLITSMILQWHDANALEAEASLSGLRKAYMLRAFVIQVWAYCAFLTGGMEHYRRVGPVIQGLYTEDWDTYIEEFGHA